MNDPGVVAEVKDAVVADDRRGLDRAAARVRPAGLVRERVQGQQQSLRVLVSRILADSEVDRSIGVDHGRAERLAGQRVRPICSPSRPKA